MMLKKILRTTVQRFGPRRAFLTDVIDENCISVVSTAQFYTNKPFTSLNVNAIVSYPVHSVSINFTKERR